MSFNNSFNAVTGATYTAAQYNTHVRDNFTAVWVYTTAGDIAYAASSSSLVRLGIGAAYKMLRVASGGNAPEWAQAPFVVAQHHDGTGHTYGSAVERQMPNSSASITPLVTSTIVVLAVVEAATAEGNCWFWYRSRCNGVGASRFSIWQYTGGIGVSVPAVWTFTGVTAGAKTIDLLEKEGYGSGLSYTVSALRWTAIAIPE